METLIGIVIGVLVGGSAFVVFLLTRLADVPRDLRLHDEDVRNLNQDLATWAADEDNKLRCRLGEIASSEGPEWAAHFPRLRAQQEDARSLVREAYRNEERVVERKRRQIQLSERWSHRLARKLWYGPLPALTARAENLLLRSMWLGPAPDATPQEQLLWGWIDPADGALTGSPQAQAA
jgi:hypothetical protein